SLSIMEFRTAAEVETARKLFRFPLLGQPCPEGWNVKLRREFNMTDDAALFLTEDGPGRLPLFTGKMFHQFMTTAEHSGYWLNEAKARRALLGSDPDVKQALDYQCHRWVYRRIARNTDSRTF